jgi:Kef-type K+ transport system membrane component KefB
LARGSKAVNQTHWAFCVSSPIASVVLGAAAAVTRPVFRMALSWVARAKSTDLFLLSVLLLALGTAFAARHAGIASPIGAFLAGMVVGESDFRHQVEDDIRPFRDVLLGLFFVTVGTEVNPLIVAVSPWATLAWTIAFLLGTSSQRLSSPRSCAGRHRPGCAWPSSWRMVESSVSCCSPRPWEQGS